MTTPTPEIKFPISENSMIDRETSIRLHCSVLRALLGEVDRKMVGVTCGLDNGVIHLRSYVDGPVEEKDIERIRRISAEVITDFVNDGFRMSAECLTTGPGKLQALDFWAFRRADE